MSNELNQQPAVAAPIQDAQPKTYNPFIDVVNEKPYTQMNVNTNSNQMSGGIPEPLYQPNMVNSNENPYNMLNNDFGSSMGSSQRGGGKNEPFNPSMNNIPDADAKMGAEHMAKLIVDGYEQLHVFANKGLQVPERKLRKLVAEGEIDLNIEIPYDYGKTISAGDFVKDFNEQNKDTLSVSKDFKKEVTPVLTRVLQKRGAGVTDEQYLMYLFGKDILVKGVIFSQIRGTMNDMLNVMKEYTVAVKEGSAPPQPKQKVSTPPPTQTSNTETKDEPVYDEVAQNYEAPDFNFQNNETVMDSSVQKHTVPQSGKARLMAQKKRDKEIAEAMARVNSLNKPDKISYQDALAKKKSGKRGRKPKDYIQDIEIDEEQIAEAIILNEQKPREKDKIEGLD
jgi:hypothetical protein